MAKTEALPSSSSPSLAAEPSPETEMRTGRCENTWCQQPWSEVAWPRIDTAWLWIQAARPRIDATPSRIESPGRGSTIGRKPGLRGRPRWGCWFLTEVAAKMGSPDTDGD